MGTPGPWRLFPIVSLLLLPIVSKSWATPTFQPLPHSNIGRQDIALHEPLCPTGYHDPSDLSVSPRATNPVTYTWSTGWTMTVLQGRILVPIDLGAEMLSTFYDQVLAYTAARMLANAAPLVVGVDIAGGPFVLDFLVMNRADSRGLEWNVVYWVAAYFQAMARRGYTGLGTVRFRHENGWELGVTLRLEWSPRVNGEV